MISGRWSGPWDANPPARLGPRDEPNSWNITLCRVPIGHAVLRLGGQFVRP
ncbi:hypothetical protein V5E97_09610 [Singulisphaera sp. Ch08]|uniref:Uncharacterized protein n=1 Tax=Singulisphaera sp. Ch08 TaxID=3120278 RepID=A0AAU7CMJ0_9BACT